MSKKRLFNIETGFIISNETDAKQAALSLHKVQSDLTSVNTYTFRIEELSEKEEWVMIGFEQILVKPVVELQAIVLPSKESF